MIYFDVDVDVDVMARFVKHWRGEQLRLKQTIKFALNKTLPVMFGYLFMGIAFGLLLQNAGYNFIWALFISLTVYAGSMQFVLISFFGSGISILTVAVMTLLINCRHMFYGLSFIEKFRSMGKRYPYMVFSLTDETYSLLCSLKVPDDLDEKRVSFAMAALDQSYWVCGCVVGAVAGQLITFDTTGVDFAMTALFVVIFVEQQKEYNSKIPVIIGFTSGILSLIIFGPDNFILPALISAVVLLLVLKGKIEKSRTFTTEGGEQQ